MCWIDFGPVAPPASPTWTSWGGVTRTRRRDAGLEALACSAITCRGTEPRPVLLASGLALVLVDWGLPELLYRLALLLTRLGRRIETRRARLTAASREALAAEVQ